MTDRSHERFLALLESHQNIVFKVASIYCWDSEERRDRECRRATAAAEQPRLCPTSGGDSERAD